jgi:beta-lactam-binding protein with PASTA domain/tRNA A-37 threonylcarbamoyl transferase component Bud32
MLMDTSLSDPLVGRLLEGRYAVEAFIAHGGMASVYLANDTRLERRVAVKVMHAHLSDDPETVARFEREARAAARLSNPDVVAVYDQGTDNGRPFLVMEFVPGTNLRQVVRERGRLSTSEALAVMDHVLAALAAAHSAGLVHRDVKPENVLVTADGRVKVADFGLARAVSGSTVTTTGSVLMGTAAYLAPEQFEHGTADERSDVYSAGVLLFELLTGSTPFEADSAYALLNRHANEDIPAPSNRASGIPPQVDALVTWATSRDPRQRPADAGEFHASLIDVRDRLGLHGGVPSLPVTLTTRLVTQPARRPDDLTVAVANGRPPVTPAAAPATVARRPRRRRRGPIIAGIIVLVVALSAVAGWWFAAGRFTQAPKVVGLSQHEADTRLNAAGLHEKWLPSIHSLTTTDGLVAFQSTSGRVTHGSTVDLRLSLGPQTHVLQSFMGDTEAVATSDLKSIHVGVGHVHYIYSQDVTKGLVVTTRPRAGQTVDEGTKVSLYISKGVEHIAIPPVVGMPQDAATTLLTSKGFVVTAPVQRYSSTVTSGTVISSHPTAGHKAAKGSNITLIVSKGPHLYQVPNVEQEPLSQAIKDIKNAGFVPEPKELFPDGPGIVDRETPTGMQAHGTTIELQYF